VVLVGRDEVERLLGVPRHGVGAHRRHDARDGRPDARVVEEERAVGGGGGEEVALDGVEAKGSDGVSAPGDRRSWLRSEGGGESGRLRGGGGPGWVPELNVDAASCEEGEGLVAVDATAG
jgi:hypothetical protein